MILSYCPTCAADRNASVIHAHEEIKEPVEDLCNHSVRGRIYRIVKCAGCETVYFQLTQLTAVLDEPFDELLKIDNFREFEETVWNSGLTISEDETSSWPEPTIAKAKRPDWQKLQDPTLIKLLESVYTALENGLIVLAAIGMRVVFDRASELIGIDPDKSFAKKLEQLHQDGPSTRNTLRF
jgi:hypothetical protein